MFCFVEGEGWGGLRLGGGGRRMSRGLGKFVFRWYVLNEFLGFVRWDKDLMGRNGWRFLVGLLKFKR